LGIHLSFVFFIQNKVLNITLFGNYRLRNEKVCRLIIENRLNDVRQLLDFFLIAQGKKMFCVTNNDTTYELNEKW